MGGNLARGILGVLVFRLLWLFFLWHGLRAHVIRLPRAATCRIRANIRPVTIELCNFPVKRAFFFCHFLKYCCGHNTCEEWVSVISTFPQPAQVERWSLDFLSPCSLFLAPKGFSSYNLHPWKASHAPCIVKLTAECPLCSTRSLSFSRQLRCFDLNTTSSLFAAEKMTSLF